MSVTRAVLIGHGVSNLRELGYQAASTDNILTDYVFRQFFRSMLEGDKGKGDAAVESIINGLIAEIDAQPDIDAHPGDEGGSER